MARSTPHYQDARIAGCLLASVDRLPLVVGGPWGTVLYWRHVFWDVPYFKPLPSIQTSHFTIQVGVLEDIN